MRVSRADRPLPVLLLGAVRGLAREAAVAVQQLDDYAPGVVALGLSPEEVRALQQHFLDPRVEPWVPLSSTELAQARGLARFGRVRIPSPATLVAIRWAAEREVPLEGVEPSDDRYSELFLQHIGTFDLLLRTRAERSVSRSPPEADTAEEFALAWEARMQAGKGSRALLQARAEHLAERLRELHSSPGGNGGRPASLKRKVALLLDVERFAPTLEGLEGAGWTSWSKPVDLGGARDTSPAPEASA